MNSKSIVPSLIGVAAMVALLVFAENELSKRAAMLVAMACGAAVALLGALYAENNQSGSNSA